MKGNASRELILFFLCPFTIRLLPFPAQISEFNLIFDNHFTIENMKQTEVLKKIGGILKELYDQYEYLKNEEDDLNDLEIELFTANANFLTDHIEILRKLNFQNRNIKKIADKPEISIANTNNKEKFFEPVVQQIKPPFAPEPKILTEPVKPAEVETPASDTPTPHINLEPEDSGDTFSFTRQEEPETIRHELILDETMNWDEDDEELSIVEEIIEPEEEEEIISITEPEVVEAETVPIIEEEEKKEEIIPVIKAEEIKPEQNTPEIKIEEIKPVVIEPAPLKKAEAPVHEIFTINQKISSQLADKAGSATEQLSIKPISDIKLAITLNDKLLFVKDLFNGYSLAYSEAIDILNRFSSFEEATRFLNVNYVTKNNWESKPETTEKFYALLKRRYA